MLLVKIQQDTNGMREDVFLSGARENWIGADWAIVPPELLETAQKYLPFVIITVQDGVVTSIADDAQARKTWEAANRPDLASVQAAKLQELSTACNATIIAGCSVTLSDATKGHISMTDEDQINLMSAQAAAQAGATGYPYHLDGDLCRVYPAADIVIMATAATRHKLYHTTYCNHLNVWVRRCETVEAVQDIFYGAELPADLAANLAEVLSHAG